ncbi:MAG: UDP-3-O-acyl-N-acetylglucosamine deacetylase [Planctomycetaceae bacterium]
MPRRQRTIARVATVTGIGLFHGADVTLRFQPAPENHGIAFQRTDLDADALVPALIDYAVPQARRTVLARQDVTVETVEHVMAALAGLQIDNCLVQLDAPEPPAGDGSAQHFADAIVDAGIVEQTAPRAQLTVHNKAYICSLDRQEELAAVPNRKGEYRLTYDLDYGHPHLPPQQATVEVTPRSFLVAVAFARTFVLEEEVAALQAQGFGRRMTPRNLLVFGPRGPIDNRIHTGDECARHKLLDCIGDLALIGCDLCADVSARRSGHRHNRELVRDLLLAHPHMREAIVQQNRSLEFSRPSDRTTRRVG